MVGEGTAVELDYCLVKISQGDLMPVVLEGMQRDEDTVTLTWNTSGVSKYSNESALVAILGESHCWYGYLSAQRFDGSLSVEIPPHIGTATHLWLSFYSLTEEKYADSVCVEL